MRLGTAIKYGAIAGLVTVVLIGIGGYAYLAATGGLSKTRNLDRAVVVFSSKTEDGAQVAQVVALVTNGGEQVEFIDPEATATVPGTSYTKLGEAYPFGGARGVAEALAGRAGGRVAYVDVPEDTWKRILPVEGVDVSLSQPLEVFDGQRLVSFKSGETTVAPGDVPHLMQGIAYLAPADRLATAMYVGKASVSAFGKASEDAVEGLETDLNESAFRVLRAALAQL